MGQRAVHAKGGIRMIIVSQNKERVLWFGELSMHWSITRTSVRKASRKSSDIQSVFRMAVLKKSQSMTARKGVWRS